MQAVNGNTAGNLGLSLNFTTNFFLNFWLLVNNFVLRFYFPITESFCKGSLITILDVFCIYILSF